MANKLGAYKKKKKNIENILARKQLLINNIMKPECVTKALADSLCGQKKFANLNVVNTSITPLSLNTLKSISEELFKKDEYEISGFEYFDNLRKELLKLVRSKKSKRNNKQDSANKKKVNEDLMNKLHQIELLNLQRSKAYLDLFQRLKVITKDTSIDDMSLCKLQNILEDHTLLYHELLSPTANSSSNAILHIINSKKDE